MAQGDAPRTARMFGTANALRDEVRAQREVLNDRFIQPRIARTRAALGEAAFAAAVADGRALPHDEAIAQTLRWLERPPQDTE